MPLRIHRQIMFGPGGGFPVFRFIFLVIVLVAIVALIVYFIREFNRSHAEHHHYAHPQPPAAPGNAPIDVLNMRFAKGEIDEDEFKRRRELLQGEVKTS